MANQGFYTNNGDNAHSGVNQQYFYTQNMHSCSGITYQSPVQYVQPYSGLKSNYESFVVQPGTQFTPQGMNLSSTQLSQFDFGNQPNLDEYQSNNTWQMKSQGLSASADNTFQYYQDNVQPDSYYMQTYNQHWVPTLSRNQGQCLRSNNLPTSPYFKASHFITSPHLPISPSDTTSRAFNTSSQIISSGTQNMFPIPPAESNGITAKICNTISRIPGEAFDGEITDNAEVYNQHSILLNPNQGTGQLYQSSSTFNHYPTHPGNNILPPQPHFSTGPQTMTGTQMMCGKNYSVVPENKEDSAEKRELEAFAQEAKKRRISLGFTQENVGDGIGVLYGHIFSQTTICRYEACQLSPSNMRKLQPIITKWFDEIESSAASREIVSKGDKPKDSAKRKRRTYLDAATKLSLKSFFSYNSHPTSKEIDDIASVIKQDSKIIRIWFCNQRQNEKRELRKMREEMEAASIHNLPLLMDIHNMPPTQAEI